MDWVILWILGIICVVTKQDPVKHKFAVLLNFPRTGEFQTLFNHVEETVDSILQSPNVPSEIELVPQIINLNTSDDETKEINRLQITREIVCQELLNGSIAVILVQHSSFTKGSVRAAYSVAAYALGFYRVPTIGVMIQDAEFSRKNLYPTFLRTSPPFSSEAVVILKLLNKLKYRQVVVITVFGDVNGLEFTTVFEENRIDHDVHVQKYIELHLNGSLSAVIAKEFEEVTSNSIILCAKRENAENIFEAAKIFTGTGKMWIVNQASAQAKNFPNGFLTVKVKQNVLSALTDALIVIKNGVKFLEDQERAFLPPEQCSSTSVSNAWTNEVGFKFYKHLIGSTFHGENNQIRFNSKGDRIQIAYEVLNKQQDRQLIVGYVNDEGDLILQEKNIYWPGMVKTKPLEITLPKHLRAVTVPDPPFTYTVPVDDPRICPTLKSIFLEDTLVHGPWFHCLFHKPDRVEVHCCAGYAIDLLSNLSLAEPNSTIDTGFSFDIHLNQSYGAVLLGDDGYVLNGVVGELDADTADLAIGALTINPEREHYIDFSEPWLYHGIRVLEKWVRQPRDSPMQSFLQPLKPTLWYCLFTAVFLVGLAIFILDLKSPFDRFYNVNQVELASDDPFWERSEEDRVTFGEAMWFVWGVLLNSGVSEKTPRSFSSRVLGIVWCGFCMIMVASYTANLAAFLVLDQPEKSLSGINDPRLRNPSANFSYATVLDTNTYQFFKRHVELSTMFRKMEGHNVKSAKDAIQQLLNGTLSAFIWDSTRVDFEAAKHCELRTRGSLFGRSAYGIGLQKHSPWTPHITNAILRLAESGMMEKLDYKWITGAGRKACVYESHKTPARLGLANMRDIFVLVAVAILLGAIFSAFEVIIGRRREKELKRKQLAKKYANQWLRISRQRKLSAQLLSPPPAPRKFSEIPIRQFQKYSLEAPKILRYGSDRPRSASPRTRPTRFVPDLNFNRLPVKCYCSRCRNAIETVPQPVLGRFAYISVVFFVLTFLWPCSLLPCFLTMFADYIHVCPICNHVVGKFRRGQKPKFYV